MLYENFYVNLYLPKKLRDFQSSLVDEFLGLIPDTTGAQNRKQELAKALLGMLIDPPAARLACIYRTCLDRGALTPDLPETPRALIGREIVGYKRRSWARMIIALEKKLRDRREQRPLAPVTELSPTLMPKMRPAGRIALMPWGSQLSTGSALA